MESNLWITDTRYKLLQQLWAFSIPRKAHSTGHSNALERQLLPIYGAGDNVRDWLFVDDHVEAIWSVATQGTWSTYNRWPKNLRIRSCLNYP